MTETVPAGIPVVEDFFGEGIAFPLDVNDAGGVADERGIVLVKMSIIQILGTRLGTRFFQEDFGSNTDRLVFAANTRTNLQRLMQYEIVKPILQWDDRVAAVDVIIQPQEASPRNEVAILINFRLKHSTSIGSLRFPASILTGRI